MVSDPVITKLRTENASINKGIMDTIVTMVDEPANGAGLAFVAKVDDSSLNPAKPHSINETPLSTLSVVTKERDGIEENTIDVTNAVGNYV